MNMSPLILAALEQLKEIKIFKVWFAQFIQSYADPGKGVVENGHF